MGDDCTCEAEALTKLEERVQERLELARGDRGHYAKYYVEDVGELLGYLDVLSDAILNMKPERPKVGE